MKANTTKAPEMVMETWADQTDTVAAAVVETGEDAAEDDTTKTMITKGAAITEDIGKANLLGGTTTHPRPRLEARS